MTFANQPAVLIPCPKCSAQMRTIERSGIHLETCPDCRGVFLDRGELDRLLDMEAASPSTDEGGRFAARGSDRPVDRGGSWQPERESERRRYRDDDDDDDDDDRRGRWSEERGDGRRPSRRGGLLSDLFENFGG